MYVPTLLEELADLLHDVPKTSDNLDRVLSILGIERVDSKSSPSSWGLGLAVGEGQCNQVRHANFDPASKHWRLPGPMSHSVNCSAARVELVPSLASQVVGFDEKVEIKTLQHDETMDTKEGHHLSSQVIAETCQLGLKHAGDWTDYLPSSAHVDFMKSRDWASTELGPMKSWPTNLRLMTRKMLSDPRPANLYWGKSRVSIYNSEFVVLAHSRHPKMMGATVQAALPMTWPFLCGVFDDIERTGTAFSLPDFEMEVEKVEGFPEEAWYDGVFSPITGDDGIVDGIYNSGSEITAKKISERRARLLHHLSAITDFQGETVWQHTAKACLPFDRDIPMLALYSAVGADTPQSLRCSLQLEEVIGVERGHAMLPDHLELHENGNEIVQALRSTRSNKCDLVLGAPGASKAPEELMCGIEWRGHGKPSTHIAVLPLFVTGLIMGFMIVGLNPKLPFDEEHAQFVKDLGRVVTGVLASTVNYEHAQAREAQLAKELTQREKFLGTLAEVATVGIYSLSADGQLTYANSKYYEVIGVAKNSAQVNKLYFVDHIEEDDQAKAIASFDDCRQNRIPTPVQLKLKKKWTPPRSIAEENCWVLASAKPNLEDFEFVGLTGCITDISHLKWAEQLQKSGAEAAKLAKLQQERFIDVTSHEMRNPLSAVIQSADDICGSIERARRFDEMDETMRRMMDSVLESAQTILLCTAHQKRIVDDILTVSKLDSAMMVITPVLVNVLDIVGQVTQMFNAELAASQIYLRYIPDDTIDQLECKWFHCDPSRLTQILVNLFTNAIKFTKSAETRAIHIGVGVSFTAPPTHVKDLHWYPSGKTRKSSVSFKGLGTGECVNLVFTVKDTGKGMTSKEISSLFNRFAQANPMTHVQYGGSGLGLFISRELTELQGGLIGLASIPGQGSTFVFYVEAIKATRDEADQAHRAYSAPGRRMSTLPIGTLFDRRNSLNQPLHTSAGTTVKQPNDISSNRDVAVRRVLLVEDNLVNQKVLSKQLQRLGCVVYIANHGMEALTFLEQTRYWRSNNSKGPSLDVILMDWEMPVLDGLSCTRKIREMEKDGVITEHLLIIATTANARDEQVQMAFNAGMDDLLAKPFKVAEVMQRITILEQKHSQKQ